jgi:Cu-Zn family superoxide dismutase
MQHGGIEMNFKTRIFTGIAVGLLAVGCSSHKSEESAAQTPAPVVALPPLTAAGVQIATAQVADSHGNNLGTVTLYKDGAMAHMTVELKGLTPGQHGIHIHAVGKCEAPSFASAGGHLAKNKHQKHGHIKGGPHTGDLPNIEVSTDGTVRTVLDLPHLKLSNKGAPVLDHDGAAVIIHAKSDDMKSQPAGNSGDRVACGVLAPVKG